MNPTLKAHLELEQRRRELQELTQVETRGEDYAGKLETAKAAVTAAQDALQAAALADAPIPEHRQENTGGVELRAMMDRANVGELFAAILEHRHIDGSMKELQDHYGLAGNQLPLGVLEVRAITPAPSDVGREQQAILPYVFPASVGAYLGVQQPVVGVGSVVYPVLTSTLSVETPAESASTTETTGAWSADVLSPGRAQASFFASVEDRARFAGMDASLRENLAAGLSDALDKEAISGTNGLLTGTNLAAHAASAVTTFDNYIANLVYGRIDGRYATGSGDIRLVMGSDAYGHAGGVYRNNSVDRTALDRLMDIAGGVRVSAHVPAASGNKQNVIIRRGSARDMVQPIWEGVTILEDPYTKRGTGEVILSGILLHATKLLRSDGYYKQEIQIA